MRPREGYTRRAAWPVKDGRLRRRHQATAKAVYEALLYKSVLRGHGRSSRRGCLAAREGGKGLTRNQAVWVHRYSIASLVIGLGVGFLLGRSLGKATTAWRSQPKVDRIGRTLLTAHHGWALVVLPVPRRWVL
jgi:hypothetical protein